MNKKDTFCVLPWMHLATNANGRLRVCCNSTTGKNYIEKPDGTYYKLFKDNLEEAWNSEVYKKIRKQMLNDERPEMCQRCFGEEDVGARSARQNWNEKWKQNKKYTIDAPFDIQYVDLRLGNLCNLKCRMCNPFSSSMWVKEWHLVEKALTPDQYKNLSNMTWPEDEKTWDNIMSISHSIKEIYLTGGEPTLIKQQYKLYDYLIEKNLASNITLKYNTNLTNIPNKLLEYWSCFKQVKINASIDAYGDLDRYIRYPSSWKKIDLNLKKFKQMKNILLKVHVTVQMYNILKLHELFEYLEMLDINVYLNILNTPKYLNIKVLPEYLKDKAALFFEKNYKIHIEKKDNISDYMFKDDWSHLYPDFINYTKTLDKSRGESLYNLVEDFSYVT